MKARKKNSNNEWKEVKYIQLEDSDILFKREYLEFDNIERTHEQIADDAYWQDVRERAAIAAMQGMLSNPQLVNATYLYYKIPIEKVAVEHVDELIKQLNEENNETN